MPERRAFLALGVTMLAIAALYIAVRPTSEPPPLPDDPIALARRLRAHPADWRAASALTEHALDARVRDRFALWRAANDVAQTLAPKRDAPRMELIRAALFHWQELSPADRQATLDTLAPMLRDRGTFLTMARPIFELTGDLGMLRRWSPIGDEHALALLLYMAPMNGRFADYRELRGELARARAASFRRKLPRLSPVEIIGALPPAPYTKDNEPLLLDALAELHRRPLTDDPHRPNEMDALIDYALRHGLEPLDGINAIVRMAGSASDYNRLRLANLFGMNAAAFSIRLAAKGPLAPPPVGQWQNLDGGTVKSRAWIDRAMTGPASIEIAAVTSDEVPPYVEIYLDDAIVAEGEVAAARTFAVPAAKGMHRLEVRVANPITRNAQPRIVRIVSVAP